MYYSNSTIIKQCQASMPHFSDCDLLFLCIMYIWELVASSFFLVKAESTSILFLLLSPPYNGIKSIYVTVLNNTVLMPHLLWARPPSHLYLFFFQATGHCLCLWSVCVVEEALGFNAGYLWSSVCCQKTSEAYRKQPPVKHCWFTRAFVWQEAAHACVLFPPLLPAGRALQISISCTSTDKKYLLGSVL